MSKILVGITSFHRKSYTELCLKALEELNTKNLEIQVIIGDNGSNQETVEFLKKYDNYISKNNINFKVIFSSTNIGVGAMLNQILQFKYVEQHFMKLDNDTILPSITWGDFITSERVNKNCLAEMVDLLENSTEEVACLGALLFDRNRKSKAPQKIITTTTGNKYITENFSDSHINGACQLYKNTVFNRILPFSENFVYGYEDSDMGVRANKFGLSLACEWLWIAHIDQLELPEAPEILEIKRKSLTGELKVPK